MSDMPLVDPRFPNLQERFADPCATCANDKLPASEVGKPALGAIFRWAERVNAAREALDKLSLPDAVGVRAYDESRARYGMEIATYSYLVYRALACHVGCCGDLPADAPSLEAIQRFIPGGRGGRKARAKPGVK